MNPFWVGMVATVLVGIATYGARVSFVASIAERELPSVVATALGYVGPAILAALVVSFVAGGDADVGTPELVALGVGGVVGWRTRSLPWVLAAGMTTLWIVRWLTT